MLRSTGEHLSCAACNLHEGSGIGRDGKRSGNNRACSYGKIVDGDGEEHLAQGALVSHVAESGGDKRCVSFGARQERGIGGQRSHDKMRIHHTLHLFQHCGGDRGVRCKRTQWWRT